MTIYIIYTRGSVRYLRFFAKSLVSFSNYNYRLVANGCSANDIAHLKELCREYPDRLYLDVISKKVVLPHGEVLDSLALAHSERYFCFMDSDIFATVYLPDLEALMNANQLSAMFSAMPLWVKQEHETMLNEFNEIIGTFNRTENDICIGGTYFAIYNHEHLLSVIRDFEVSFDSFFFNQLAEPLQKVLTSLNLNKRLYDTGKIINILLAHRDRKMDNIHLPQLCHIGGTSFEVQNRYRGFFLLKKLKSFVANLTIVKRFRNNRPDNISLLHKRYTSQREFQINYEQRIVYRDVVRGYFLELFCALSKKSKLPELPKLASAEILKKIETGREQYILAFEKFNR